MKPEKLPLPQLVTHYRDSDYFGNCYNLRKNEVVVVTEHIFVTPMALLQCLCGELGNVLEDILLQGKNITQWYDQFNHRSEPWFLEVLDQCYQHRRPGDPFFLPIAFEQAREIVAGSVKGFSEHDIEWVKHYMGRSESGIGHWSLNGFNSTELKDLAYQLTQEFVALFDATLRKKVIRAHEWTHYLQARRFEDRDKLLQLEDIIISFLRNFKKPDEEKPIITKEQHQEWQILERSLRTFKEMEAIIIEMRLATKNNTLRNWELHRFLDLIDFYKRGIGTGQFSTFEHYAATGDLYQLDFIHDYAVIFLLFMQQMPDLLAQQPGFEVSFLTQPLTNDSEFGPAAVLEQLLEAVKNDEKLRACIWNKDILGQVQAKQHEYEAKLLDLWSRVKSVKAPQA